MSYRYDAIVVLGAAVRKGGKPGAALRRRSDTAIALYRHGYAPAIIASGGVGKYPPAEAKVFRRWAIAKGVPAGAIMMEFHSRSTAENVLLSAKLLNEIGARKIVVVTDGYHLMRATFGFRKLGFETDGFAARSPTGRGLLTVPVAYLRELLIFPMYWLQFNRLYARQTAR